MFASLSGRELAFVLAALFVVVLLVLGGLAYIAIKLLGRKESGTPAAGVTGCAVAGLFGCLGLLLVFTLGLFAILLVAGRAAERVIDHLPSGRWRVEHREHLPPPAPWTSRADLIFRARGENVDFEPVLAIVREIAGADTSTTLTSRVDDGGTAISELRVGVRAEGEELIRIDDAVEVRTAGLRLADGTEIEYLGVRRDV